MQDFFIIYKILRILQRSMDLEEFNKESLSPEQLELSKPTFTRGGKQDRINPGPV